MRIRIIGGGWYGCSITLGLLRAGHDVELHEQAPFLFAGASGANPARLHQGFHYPRSHRTRQACQEHNEEFMQAYGHLTRAVPINIYAIAEHDSQVDFGTYCKVLRPELEFITMREPYEFGLRHVDGAIITGERHIIIDQARQHFEIELAEHVTFCQKPGDLNDTRWDFSIDCTFCALDAENIDRYEPCLTVLLEGPTNRSVTIMDGAFPSIYVWNEQKKLSSLTSALYTPFSKGCKTWAEARALLDGLSSRDIVTRSRLMLDQIAYFWPAAADEYMIADERLSIRAMPRSGSDARLVDVIRVGERALRVRAGKIDAIFHAERLIKELIGAA